MATCQDLIDNLKAFDVKSEAVKVIVANKSEYLNRNKDQFRKGMRPNGFPIGKYKLKWYADMKFAQSSEAGFGNVDLELDKGYKLGMWLKVDGEDILVSSSDDKADKLEAQYHKDSNPIYGLSSENQQSFNYDVFLPGFLAVIEQKTGLKAK
jgi:hypothetical protein